MHNGFIQYLEVLRLDLSFLQISEGLLRVVGSDGGHWREREGEKMEE